MEIIDDQNKEYLDQLYWLGILTSKIGNDKKSLEIFLKLNELSKILLK